MSQPAALAPEDILYEAACVACRAPSIANSQPWLWRIRADTLELRADYGRQLTVADPHGQLLVMSCGALLHHATVMLAVLGVSATVERVNDPSDPDLLARVALTGPHEVTADDMRMHHALRTRRTDRRPFRGTRPLPGTVIDLIRRAAEPFGVSLHVFDPAEVGLLAHAAHHAATIAGRDPARVAELVAWTTGRDPASRSGVPPTVAVPQVPRVVPVRDFAPGGVPEAEAGPGDDRYTTYAVLATTTDHTQDWMNAGEAASAALLTATTLGVATSLSSELVEVPGARALLHSIIAPAGFPQLVMRLGVNESGAVLPMTPRRPCTEVITVVREKWIEEPQEG
jgi:hypothetical protein